MTFANRTNMSPVILHADLLDGQRDAAWAVGDGVSHGAVLESFVFDVVAQQLIVWAPPLNRELGDVRVVLIVVGTRHRDPLTRLSKQLYFTACRQRGMENHTGFHIQTWLVKISHRPFHDY